MLSNEGISSADTSRLLFVGFILASCYFYLVWVADSLRNAIMHEMFYRMKPRKMERKEVVNGGTVYFTFLELNAMN